MSKSLSSWLTYIEKCHPNEIDLTLERPSIVLRRLLELESETEPRSFNIAREQCFSFPVITIAGTNGKGSTVAVLEALALQFDLKPIVFTTPHFFNYRERVKYNGKWLSEKQHCDAFEAVDNVRGDIQLTYFEYSTLAMFKLADELKPDVLILEVGLGGRLDAVNIIKADIAIITTIALEHQQWLGDTLEEIATEKAGIVHSNSTLVIADSSFPLTVKENIANKVNHFYQAGTGYQYTMSENEWQWQYMNHGPWTFDRLSFPEMNAAASLTAWFQLTDYFHETSQLTVDYSQSEIQSALDNIDLQARFQVINRKPLVILDVAHNPQAMNTQANLLQTHSVEGDTRLVLGMLDDKNTLECLDILNENIDYWYLCELDNPRSAQSSEIKSLLQSLNESSNILNSRIQCYNSVVKAFKQAWGSADESDRILITGSFYTVAPVLDYIQHNLMAE